MLIMISISQLTNWVWIKYLNLVQLIHIFETAEKCMLLSQTNLKCLLSNYLGYGAVW